MSRDLLAAIEQAAVRGWPALESATIGGWLWRHASGGSIRANSVATLAWSGGDVGDVIVACEARYRARGAACVFTISDVSVPRDLDALLDVRGYARGDDHVTMAKAVPAVALWPERTRATAEPDEAWFATYLSGLSENRRGVARQLIENLPPAARFYSVVQAGVAVASGSQNVAASCGMSIVDGRLASVQCMATEPGFRRQGSALLVLAAIEAYARQQGATHVYLQTGGDNLAAQSLYGKFGFEVIGRYHTRTRPLAT